MRGSRRRKTTESRLVWVGLYYTEHEPQGEQATWKGVLDRGEEVQGPWDSSGAGVWENRRKATASGAGE